MRGFYSAVQLIGANSVLHLLPGALAGVPPNADIADLPQPLTHVLVTPFHEAYGRLAMPAPFDMNLLVRLSCRLGHEVDPTKMPDWAILQASRLDELQGATLWLAGTLSTMTTTAAYSWQITGHALQAYAWPGQNPPQTEDLFNLGLLTVGEEEQPPILMWAAVRLLTDCCGFTIPLDFLAGRNWAPQPVNLPGAIQPWNFGLAFGHFGFPYTWGNPLAISRTVVHRPLE